MRYDPYSATLRERLEEEMPEFEIAIETEGESGQMVTGGFLERMQYICMSGFTYSVDFIYLFFLTLLPVHHIYIDIFLNINPPSPTPIPNP